jgi:hypothetical protein
MICHNKDALNQMRSRIKRKGIYGEDIKVKDLLTDDEIADLSVDKIHTWIRQGKWSQKEFKKWLKIIRVIE